MARKKKELPILENVTITDVAAEGKALARVDDLVVFVPYVVPGDVVDLQVKRKKHHYAEAEAVRFHHYSEKRAEPFCEHFGVCGGCKWQCLPYEEQLRYKQQQVVDNLTRIGKVALPPISPILGSRRTRAYRNKLEFGFSNKKWLTAGQIASGVTFDNMNAILDIHCCHLMDDVCNRLRNGIRDYAFAHGLTFFDLRQQQGLLRNMMIRTSTTGELMLLMQFCWREEAEREQAMALLAYLRDTFPEVTSLLYVNNLKCNDTIGDLDVATFSGTGFIYEEMEGLRFKVGPKSFYQTNSDQAYELYKVARRFAGLTGGELVYDLYTGTGTIANFVAGQARKVVGIEYVPEAIADAKVNARLNGLEAKTAFFAGDMKDLLTPEVVRTILLAAPRRIVYVSCNPATQARDLQLLDAAYKIEAVQPVDMFPQTHHVENVVLLVKRDE